MLTVANSRPSETSIVTMESTGSQLTVAIIGKYAHLNCCIDTSRRWSVTVGLRCYLQLGLTIFGIKQSYVVSC